MTSLYSLTAVLKNIQSNAVGVCTSIFSVCVVVFYLFEGLFGIIPIILQPKQHADYFWHTSERNRQCLNISISRCSVYV